MLICTQAAAAPATAWVVEFAELKRQLDVVDDDIMLVNKRLDEAQGMSFGRSVSINKSMMLGFIICFDCRWCCRDVYYTTFFL